MSLSLIAGGAVPARTGVTLMARLRAQNGQLLTRASVSEINWRVSNLVTGATLNSGQFAATTVFDDLQTDARWTVDSAVNPGPDGASGYNFLAVIPASSFALSTLAAPGVLSGFAKGQTMQADVAFVPVTGEQWRVIFRWQILPVYV